MIMRAHKIESSKEHSEKAFVLTLFHAYELIMVSHYHTCSKFINNRELQY